MKRICLIWSLSILSIVVSGCSPTNEESSKDIVKQETKSDANNKNKDDNENIPSVDENCEEVYGKEECEKFLEYYESEEGQEEFEEEKTNQQSPDVGKKEIYEKASWLLKEMLGAPERVEPLSYENSIVEKLDDNLYYIYSLYKVKGTGVQGDKVHEFEMLMNKDFELIDAYLPGSYGRFSNPIVHDKLNNLKSNRPL